MQGLKLREAVKGRGEEKNPQENEEKDIDSLKFEPPMIVKSSSAHDFSARRIKNCRLPIEYKSDCREIHTSLRQPGSASLFRGARKRR